MFCKCKWMGCWVCADLSRYCRRSVSGPLGKRRTFRSKGNRCSPSNQMLLLPGCGQTGTVFHLVLRTRDSPSWAAFSPCVTVTIQFKTSSHLQSRDDLVLDVSDNVAFDSWVIGGFQCEPETRQPMQVNALWWRTEIENSVSFQGGEEMLTRKNCTLLWCQTYQYSSGISSDLWFSVDKGEWVFCEYKCKLGALGLFLKLLFSWKATWYFPPK